MAALQPAGVSLEPAAAACAQGSPRASVHVKTPPQLTPREQCEGDWEFWCELMDTMLNGGKMPARAKVAACRAAVAAGDAKELRMQAHALKSTSAALCAKELSRRCAELERSAQVPESQPSWAGQVEELAEALSRLDLTFRWVWSMGAAERAETLESVNGCWELLRQRETGSH